MGNRTYYFDSRKKRDISLMLYIITILVDNNIKFNLITLKWGYRIIAKDLTTGIYNKIHDIRGY